MKKRGRPISSTTYEIARLAYEGYRIRHIAEMLGMNYNAVRYIIRTYRLPTNTPRSQDKPLFSGSRIGSALALGFTLDELALLFRRSPVRMAPHVRPLQRVPVRYR